MATTLVLQSIYFLEKASDNSFLSEAPSFWGYGNDIFFPAGITTL